MINDIHHLGLTVRDVEASADWYQRVLGFQRVGEYAAPDGARRKVFLRHDGLRARIGLTEHRDGTNDLFDETRTGLDHLSFGVASPADLDDWAQRFFDAGVVFSPVASANSIAGAGALVFRDPDNIQLELFFDPSTPVEWSGVEGNDVRSPNYRRALVERQAKEDERMKTPPIVSPQDWKAAREKLLVKEKELTRARDAMAAERRRMPWTAVDKEYWFEGSAGRVSLADVFEGRRQLILYRAFYGPEVTTYAEGGSYPERACVGCSFVADQVAHPGHLNARNTTLAFASRAPQADIQKLKQRHGWEHIPWYTITDDFDKDFDVDKWHGTNAFIRNDDRIFRTYFIDSRGDEQMGNTWSYLDITALGRQEEWEDSPEDYPQTPAYQWWNYHDAYPGGEMISRLRSGR